MTRKLLYIIASVANIAIGCLFAREFFRTESYGYACIALGGMSIVQIIFLAMFDHEQGARITLRHHELMVAQDHAAMLRSPDQQSRVEADRKSRDSSED